MNETTSPASPTDPGDSRSRGTDLATLGFLMAATGPILLVAGTLLWGLDSEDTVFFAVPSVLGLLGAFLIRRSHTAARIVALVMAVLIAGAVFWTIFGVTEVASFLDFMPGLLVVPGVLLALFAGITSIRSRKRGRAVGPGERRAVTVIVGLLGILAVASLVLTVTGRDTVDDDLADDADLVVDLKDFEFDQAAYDVPGGSTILVKNSDPFIHNFAVEDLNVDVDLGPGSEALVTIPEQPGTYILFCEPHTDDPDDPGEEDMAAILEVG